MDEELDLTALTPDRALKSGIALMARRSVADGAVDTLSVGENVLLPVLDRYAAGGRLDRGRMRKRHRGNCSDLRTCARPIRG